MLPLVRRCVRLLNEITLSVQMKRITWGGARSNGTTSTCPKATLKLHLVSVVTGGESNTVTRSMTPRITLFCTQEEGVQTFYFVSFSIAFFTSPLWNLMRFTHFSILVVQFIPVGPRLACLASVSLRLSRK